MMKISKELATQILWDGAPDEYEIVDKGQWASEGKYEYREVIFKYENKYYAINDRRSGSYFTYYWYEHEDWDDEIDVREVEPQTKIITVYVTVKKEKTDESAV